MPVGRPKKVLRSVSSDSEEDIMEEKVEKVSPEKTKGEAIKTIIKEAVENKELPSNKEIKQSLKEEGIDHLTKKDLDLILSTINEQLKVVLEANERFYEKVKKQVHKNHLDTQIEQSREQLDKYFKFR